MGISQPATMFAGVIYSEMKNCARLESFMVFLKMHTSSVTCFEEKKIQRMPGMTSGN